MGNKGFVFTIDAIVGAAIIAFVVLSFTFTVKQPVENDRILERQAVDTLFILEERGDIATKDKATINQTIREFLPSSVSYTYTVQYYDVASDGSLSFDTEIHEDFVPEDEDVVFSLRPVPITADESGTSNIQDLSQIAKARLGVSLG